MDADVTTRLSLPALSRYGRVARLAAAAVAAEAAMGVDDIEDVRTAVSELFSVLVDDDPSESDTVDLELVEEEDGIEIRGERRVSSPTADFDDLDSIAHDILSMVTDHFEIDAHGDVRRFRIRKTSRVAESA